MSDRISAAQLDNAVRACIEMTELATRYMSERDVARGEAEAATRALRDLLEIVERELVSDLSDTELAYAYAYSDQHDVERDAIAEQNVRMAVAAARALVGSENAARGSSVRTQERASDK